MDEREAILLLSLVPSVTPTHIKSLRAGGLSIAEALRDLKSIPSEIEIWNEAIIQKIEEAKSQNNISELMATCQKQNIHIVTFEDLDYPKFLKNIHKPPLALYVRGNLMEEDSLAVAIVGARHASPYGLRVAYKIGYELGEAGVTVVSGLARGIDGEAHRGALHARGRTIAVLGSGINVIYPKEHERLYEEIAESGAVISEFPIGTPPHAYNFPNRNRIIAGLSQGVLVVEAHYRSGSLITATLATEEGREVYAIPGQIDSIQSNGTHELLKQGAKLVTSSEDILADLTDVFGSLLEKTDANGENESPNQEKFDDPKEEELFHLIQNGTVTMDEIREKTGFDFPGVCAILTELELKGRVKRGPGGIYEIL